VFAVGTKVSHNADDENDPSPCGEATIVVHIGGPQCCPRHEDESQDRPEDPIESLAQVVTEDPHESNDQTRAEGEQKNNQEPHWHSPSLFAKRT